MDSLSSKEDVKAAMQSIDDLKQQIRSFVNLEHLKVPMIVYLGGSAHIADVFANLNKGGVPLTKYEVFGAAWLMPPFGYEGLRNLRCKISCCSM